MPPRESPQGEAAGRCGRHRRLGPEALSLGPSSKLRPLFVRLPSWCSPSTTNGKRQGRRRTRTPRWKGHGEEGRGARCGCPRVRAGGPEKHRDSEGRCEYPRDHGSHKHQTPLAPGSSPMRREASAWSERLGKASPQRRGMCRVSKSREERQCSRHRTGVCKGPMVRGH